jgi:hypothetical protein
MTVLSEKKEKQAEPSLGLALLYMVVGAIVCIVVFAGIVTLVNRLIGR